VVLNTDGTVSAVSPTGTPTPADRYLFLAEPINDRVFKYEFGTIGDLSTLSYTGDSVYVFAQAQAPRGVNLNSDGSIMYVADDNTDTIFQYTLSSPYDITSATYANKSFSVATQETSLSDLAFNNDGTKAYVVGAGSDTVWEYALGTAYDISTASVSSSYSVSGFDTQPKAVTFNNDGTRMFVCGLGSGRVAQYSLSTAFSVSSASYTAQSSIATNSAGIRFNADGTKLYSSIDYSTDQLQEYSLSSAFTISTLSGPTATLSISGQTTSPGGIALSGVSGITNLSATNVNGYGNFLGFSDGSYADGATATIQVVGAINESQSGLLAGYRYYIQTDGTLSTTAGAAPGNIIAGYALAPTKLLIRGAYEYVVR